MTITKALRIVLDLAHQNVIEDDDMYAERARQDAAIREVESWFEKLRSIEREDKHG